MSQNTAIFTLTSPEFTEGATLDSRYQSDRDNQSPALQWQHAPAGARQMRNDGGTQGYMGCYPPAGDPPHRYIFTVYALDTDDLAIPSDASTSKAGFAVNAHTLAKAHLTAYYAR